MVPGPLNEQNWPKAVFAVVPQPDDLGFSNLLERLFGHIASSGSNV